MDFTLKLDEIVKKEPVDSFDNNPLNVKAIEDFKYLLSHSGLANSVRLGHVVVSSTREICDCVVVGANEQTPMIKIPKNRFTVENNAYITVVAYQKAEVQGVYMFDVNAVKKTGLFSMFKDLKKEDAYGIKADGLKKCEDNKYGNVLKDYLK